MGKGPIAGKRIPKIVLIMIRRYWIVTCNYCGMEYRFNGSTKPEDFVLKDSGIVVRSQTCHLCKKCVADYDHDIQVKRAGNLTHFQPGKTFERT